MKSIQDALKATRRGMHVHGAKWRALIVVERADMIIPLMEETYEIMDAGSLPVATLNRAQRLLTMANGATIRFATVRDLEDTYMLSGGAYTQIVWYREPEDELEAGLRPALRSDDAKAQADVRWDYVR